MSSSGSRVRGNCMRSVMLARWVGPQPETATTVGAPDRRSSPRADSLRRDITRVPRLQELAARLRQVLVQRAPWWRQCCHCQSYGAPRTWPAAIAGNALEALTCVQHLDSRYAPA